MIFSQRVHMVFLILPFALAACGHSGSKNDVSVAAKMTAARLIAAPPPQAQPIILPKILPGQLKKLEREKTRRNLVSPVERIAEANQKARVQPAGEGFINAVQVYPWTEGSLYQVYTAPGQISDIALQPGERLIGSGPVAAGDTVRWIIGDTISGSGTNARVHILVKPIVSRLSTNLIINTDRRTYHLELVSTPKAYMASVSWTYPQDAFRARTNGAASMQTSEPIAGELSLESLNFSYRISGDKPAWRPIRVFDDGRQVFITFPANIGTSELPPLFVLGVSGNAELVNYRVRHNHMIVDRLFEIAELRLGAKQQQIVRISRRKKAGRR
ncbi:MAG: P-type conjugative transfer protein TrbG [Sphingomonadales bacterium]|nr:P-type conjugative transfer protein TrbG [Sphingomonadales bacterium]